MTTQTDIQALGTILGIWAHPDDETFTMAGIIATATMNGQVVACVTATKGEAGSQDEVKWPSSTIAEVRQKELEAALRVLGVQKHFWLGYVDGKCAEVPVAEAVSQLVAIIERIKPDSIFTFGPEGMTGHPDHQTVSAWTSQAVEKSGQDIAIYHAVITPEQYEKYIKQADEKLNIFFNIDKPPLVSPENCDICINNADEVCEKKCDAIAAQPSQTELMIKHFGRDFLKEAFRTEAFVRAK